MVTFLAPAALFFSALLAIPILVHIFKPRKLRQTPFSSLRWLRLTQQRLSRRIRWHQIFLFLLRAAFVLLMVLALAKPMFSEHGQVGFTERFIVLDVSRSMGYQASDRPSPLELGKQLAADLAAHHLAGDRTAILLTGATTQVLTPLVREAEVHLPALRKVQSRSSDTDLSSALAVIRPMLAHCRSDAQVELYFLTDNHQQSWSQGGIATFLKDLTVDVHAHVIDVSVLSPQNAWIADARLLRGGRPVRHLLRAQIACVGDANQERTVRLTGLQGVPERTQSVTLSPGKPAQVDFELPEGYDLSGKVADIRIEPPDSLPSDDQFFLNLDTKAALKVLLVEGESTQVESLRSGFHLHTAVDALATASGNALELTTKTHAAATPQDFTAADVILLADVPEVNEANLMALETRVKAGAGLALFLGPNAKPSFYNTKLYKPLAPAEGLLSAPLNNVAEPDPKRGNLAPLTNVRWQHPLLTRLFDPILGDLALTHFRSFYQFTGPLPETDAVLAWIDDTTPAIVERTVGAGRVILFNTTANDDWSDLPRRKSFVPLIDRLLSTLSGGGVRRTFEIGEAIVLPLRDLKTGESVTVLTPSGERVTPSVQTTQGRTDLRLDAASEPGVYHVERDGGKGFAFVVQVGRGDSVLTPLDTTTLKKWWEPVELEALTPEAATKGLVASQDRFALWPWMALAACVMLLLEMFFVHWLCPRVNPNLTTSVVHRQRILAPLEKEKV